ncbi:hypothetical protein [Pseudomonas sp. FGI182]|uniref:hypothetical protein n=1 Tax=Pseudomonas sp. FGI182 TaxID=1259844 RepID=UPI0012DC92C7|nr:hypothetical protein [Pseudomonas sp. FGI182]
MINKLAEVLGRARLLAGKDFTGLGVVVCDSSAELPVFPLRLDVEIPIEDDVATILAGLSTVDSDLHDGFHVLSPDLKLIALSQYFSPSIAMSAVINRSRKFGGRYVAAIFGSMLPGVCLCGISTKSLGVVIFKDGREVYFEGV